MKQKVGEVFSISGEHAPVPGCTVSEMICDGENAVTVFSLAAGTDISAEMLGLRLACGRTWRPFIQKLQSGGKIQ